MGELWDVYAEQLLPLGHGYPLWNPGPVDNNREVLLGDVGWLKYGQFRPLFNSMKSGDHPANAPKGVPDDFTVLESSNMWIGGYDKPTQKILHSRGIRTTECPKQVGDGSVSLTFRTTTNRGALVMLQTPVRDECIKSKRRIVNYIRDNFESWLEFANASNSWGLELRERDIIFVSGTTKTSRWGVSVFQDKMFAKKDGHIMGDVDPLTMPRFAVSIANVVLPNIMWGPQHVSDDSGDQRSQDTAVETRDQCVFIHYYKMKRRLWRPFKSAMRAAAGPHELPHDAENDGGDRPLTCGAPVDRGPGVSEPDSDDNEGYDPVDGVLDYILQHSNARIAIASDQDAVALFSMAGFTDTSMGWRNATSQQLPLVEVDEYGVGTISAMPREHSEVRAARTNRADVGDWLSLASCTQQAKHYGERGNRDVPIPTFPMCLVQPLTVVV